MPIDKRVRHRQAVQRRGPACCRYTNSLLKETVLSVQSDPSPEACHVQHHLRSRIPERADVRAWKLLARPVRDQRVSAVLGRESVARVQCVLEDRQLSASEIPVGVLLLAIRKNSAEAGTRPGNRPRSTPVANRGKRSRRKLPARHVRSNRLPTAQERILPVRSAELPARAGLVL